MVLGLWHGMNIGYSLAKPEVLTNVFTNKDETPTVVGPPVMNVFMWLCKLLLLDGFIHLTYYEITKLILFYFIVSY